MNYLAFFIITTFAIQTVLPSGGKDSVGILLVQISSAIASIALAAWVLAS